MVILILLQPFSLYSQVCRVTCEISMSQEHLISLLVTILLLRSSTTPWIPCTSSFVQMGLDLRRIVLSLSRKKMRIFVGIKGYWVLCHRLPCCELFFFYNGKNFCLRGGEEHRSLKLSQFTKTQNGYIVYTKNVSKNRQGGISQVRLK